MCLLLLTAILGGNVPGERDSVLRLERQDDRAAGQRNRRQGRLSRGAHAQQQQQQQQQQQRQQQQRVLRQKQLAPPNLRRDSSGLRAPPAPGTGEPRSGTFSTRASRSRSLKVVVVAALLLVVVADADALLVVAAAAAAVVLVVVVVAAAAAALVVAAAAAAVVLVLVLFVTY